MSREQKEINEIEKMPLDQVKAQLRLHGINDYSAGLAETINLFELHQKMTSHLFPSYSSTDERFLALGLCGEVGELANMIKKRWRDGVDLTEEIRDEIADIRVYLELIAKCFDIEGSKLDDRVQKKLEQVVIKHAYRLNKSNGAEPESVARSSALGGGRDASSCCCDAWVWLWRQLELELFDQ
jgi:NTP pyrophosphatase (non-canonical NTP hydrolase)